MQDIFSFVCKIPLLARATIGYLVYNIFLCTHSAYILILYTYELLGGCVII